MPQRVSFVYRQKLTLKPCVDVREHQDVRPGAEHLVLRGSHHDHPHLRVLEPDALDRVGQLDVDAEVVAVLLEFVVVGAQAVALLDVHHQGGGGTLERELPVPVAVGVRRPELTAFALLVGAAGVVAARAAPAARDGLTACLVAAGVVCWGLALARRTTVRARPRWVGEVPIEQRGTTPS
jgi:hypothetical protein